MLLLLFHACSHAEPPPPEPAPSPSPSASAPIALPAKAAGTQILVTWSGAAGAPVGVTRSEAEAEARAQELWKRVTEGGEDFEAVAREASDGVEAPRGGRLGTWLAGTMVPAFEEAVAAVPVGGVTKPFRTPFGWHVVRRDPVEEAHLRHVLVSWSGAWRSPATRTKEQARARIEEALRRIDAGEPFEVVARELSDDPTAQVGGDLGVVGRGQLVPAVEDAGFALEPGAHSAIVESPYGFHVIWRD
ncbi:MAG: peptidylprolyl isomerase [Alphaproteobacteria bacterium]|nr:peptidylprolyl isomerase [Alphaproteobacteria bacterium]